MSRLLNSTRKYSLNINYRNGYNILAYAQNILEINDSNIHDTSICGSGKEGYVLRMQYNIDSIIKKIEDDLPYSNWFFLTRNNSQLQMVYDDLTSRGIPCITFKKADSTSSELKNKLKDNSVKILTIHTAKGLEAKNVFVYGAAFNSDEEIRVSYVAATRAKEKLFLVKAAPKKKKKKTDDIIINWF